MSTEYLKLNADSRPELMSGLTPISTEYPKVAPMLKQISINENKLMNMSLNQIFDKIINRFYILLILFLIFKYFDSNINLTTINL